MENESDGDINYNWCVRNDPQKVCLWGWKSLILKDEQKPSRLQDCLDSPEYWEESLRKLAVSGLKNTLGEIIIKDKLPI